MSTKSFSVKIADPLTMCFVVKTYAPDNGNVLWRQGSVKTKHAFGHVCGLWGERITARKLLDLQLPLVGQLAQIGIRARDRLAIFDRAVRARAVANKTSPGNVDRRHIDQCSFCKSARLQKIDRHASLHSAVRGWLDLYPLVSHIIRLTTPRHLVHHLTRAIVIDRHPCTGI